MSRVNFSEGESKREYRLVFAILDHEVFGAIYESYVVEVTDFGEFSLSHRKVNPRTVLDYAISLVPGEEEVLQLVEEYSEEVLMRKFSRGLNKVSEFIASISDQVFQDHIRPYIEKRMHQISNLLESHFLPIYYKGKRKDFIQDRPIHFRSGMTEVIFNFSRKEAEGSEYYLSMLSNGKEVSLTGKKGRVLTMQPCLVFVEDAIFRIDERVDGNKLNPFFTKHAILIPKGSERKYFESFVLNAIRNFSVHAEGFSIEELSRECKPLLKLENSLDGKPCLEVYFMYGDRQVHPSEQSMQFAEFSEKAGSYHFEKYKRQIEVEKGHIDSLLQMNLFQNAYQSYSLKTESEEGQELLGYIQWLNERATVLASLGFEVVKSPGSKDYFIGGYELKMEIREQKDWFDVNAFVRFGEFDIPFIKFRQHIFLNKQEYQLPNGQIVVLPKAWFSRYRDLVQLGTGSGEQIRLKLHHAGVLKVLEPERELSFYQELTSGLQQEEHLIYRVPDALQARLRPYQLEGYKWMSLLQKYQFGGCLADDMGLGKTLQTLALLASLPADGEKLKLEAEKKTPAKQLDLFSETPKTEEYQSHTSLIVMPLSLIWNWENEIRKFTPHLKIYKHFGSGRTSKPAIFYQFDLVLTTYGVVRNDLEMFARCEFRYVILDESQLIKNPFSKLYRAVKLLKARHRLVLTGTPIENSLADLWAQMSFLNHGMLGSLAYFKEEYAIPIEKNRDAQKEAKLRTLIAPFLLRRTKDMVARDLPSLTEMTYYCEMGEEQKELYEQKKSEIRNLILRSFDELGAEKSRFAILRGLMQLRLLANHSSLLPDGPDLVSGKYEEVMHSIRNIIAEGHKVLVFSSFVKHLRLFSKALDQEGWGYCVLTGEKSTPERAEAVKRFQEDEEKKVFLITLKAGGVGLNLTAADYVFILEPWWNPASENQAISRAHRIGQDKKVIAFKFITRGTIEEKILSLQQNKSEIASLFVNQNDPLKYFTRDTIVQLTE